MLKICYKYVHPRSKRRKFRSMYKMLVIAMASAILLATSSTLISSLSIQSEADLSVSNGGSASSMIDNIIKGRHSNPMIPVPPPNNMGSSLELNIGRPIIQNGSRPTHRGPEMGMLPHNSSATTRNPFILPNGLHGGPGPVVIRPRPSSTVSGQNPSSTRNPFILPNGVHLGHGPVVLKSTTKSDNMGPGRSQNGSYPTFKHPGLPLGPGPVVLKTTTTLAPSSAGGCSAPKLDKLAKRLAAQLQLEAGELEQIERLVEELLARTAGKRKNCSPPAETLQLSRTTIVVDLMQRFNQQLSHMCH